MTTADPFDARKPLAGRALEIALNRLLALDGDARAEIARLDGRRVELSLAAPVLALTVRVEGDRLRVGPASAGDQAEPDLAIRGTLGALLGQLPFLRDEATFGNGRLRVSGDAELAQRLQRLARGFDPDWEKPFADLFGEVPGGAIARTVREALAAGLKRARTLARDAAEYLVEESRDVVGQPELDAFHDDVDALRDAVERFAARIERLAARLPEPQA